MNRAPAENVIEATNRKSLGFLLHGMSVVDPGSDCEVTGIEIDSRNVGKGDLFLAMPGGQVDGRNFISQAAQAGVAAIVYEQDQSEIDEHDIVKGVPTLPVRDLSANASELASRFYGDPSAKMSIIGVTGTNGKTTFSYMVAQAFELLGDKCAMMGTVGNGYPNRLEKAKLTTDNAVLIQQRLSNFVKDNAAMVCMEVSSHGLSQNRVKAVDFDVAVFTNLSQDHLDYHLTIERYGAEKAKLFQFPELKLAIINEDDEFGQKLMRQHRAKRCLSYGISKGDITPQKLVVDQDGIRFDVIWEGKTVHVDSALVGHINVGNLLAVVACLLGYGITHDRVSNVIGALSAPPGRMEMFRPEDPTLKLSGVAVDYSHTPDALERALISLRNITKGELWVVFGCGGDRDQGKRALMGAVAELHADRVIVTDDNPRTESPAVITDQIISGMSQPAMVIHDRELAIKTAIDSIANGDSGFGIVLVAGKGHEDYQITQNGVVSLSDREIVKKAMEGRS